MEEKVKLSNLKNVDSAGSLHLKYQELLKALQGKDELIGQLQAQLEKQVGATVQRSARALCNPCTLGPSCLSRASLLGPPVAGCSLPQQIVLSRGDGSIGRYIRSEAGIAETKGPWRQTDLGLNPSSSTCCSLGKLLTSLILIYTSVT